MWVLLALGSAVFAGVTSVLAKCGIRKTDSTVATAIRTAVVLLMSFLMVCIVGSLGDIREISAKTWIFLILSGLATGASWLCYFRALQLGDVNRVVPIDKSSTVLTILLAFVILGEPISPLKGVCVVLIAVGTYLMIERRRTAKNGSSGAQQTNEAQTKKAPRHRRSWLLYACLSAVFAALTSILGKIGIEGVESSLGTMIRTGVVLLMSWLMVPLTGKCGALRGIPGRELVFIGLSGLATGASWLCYYRALQLGPASAVVPIDKLSILLTVTFSCLFLHEKISLRLLLGLLITVTGTLLLLVGA